MYLWVGIFIYQVSTVEMKDFKAAIDDQTAAIQLEVCSAGKRFSGSSIGLFCREILLLSF